MIFCTRARKAVPFKQGKWGCISFPRCWCSRTTAGHNENVTIPYAAGCQTVGIYPYKESESDPPRAMAGLTDLSARFYICKQLGDNLMTFAVPLKKVVNNDCFL